MKRIMIINNSVAIILRSWIVFMTEILKCNKLSATFNDKQFKLGGPYNLNFNVEKESSLSVSIQQIGSRQIIIESDEDIDVNNMFSVLTNLEKLLMMFDGKFIPLTSIKLTSDIFSSNMLRNEEINFKKKRLNYYTSAKYFNITRNSLLDIDKVIFDRDLFYKWENLLDELDIVHQLYLYFMSDTKLTIDIICAFFIELAEPLIEIAKNHTNYFASLNPGERGSSLRKCLEALISKYGEDIFQKEISDNYNGLLSAMVKSRVRIMHIKNKQGGKFFNGEESYIYIFKMSLLYRRVIFEILDIKYEKYRDKLICLVSKLNEHEKILQNFLDDLNK